MKETTHAHLEKQKFQLDRVALFSDAVFAISITLLAIEIKVPEVNLEHLSDKTLGHALLTIIPRFIGFILSFFVVGLYWLSHYRLFRYVGHCSQQLIWNNLIFLLSIVIMPFSTVFLSEYYYSSLRLPLAFYTLNICFSGFFSYRLWSIVGKEGNKLSIDLPKVVVKYNKARAVATPLVFVFISLLSFINPFIAHILPPFILILGGLIRRYYYRKYPAIMKLHLG
ncbi:MAG: TMEM175 family protein [Chitinophagaceae bacterium]